MLLQRKTAEYVSTGTYILVIVTNTDILGVCDNGQHEGADHTKCNKAIDDGSTETAVVKANKNEYTIKQQRRERSEKDSA